MTISELTLPLSDPVHVRNICQQAYQSLFQCLEGRRWHFHLQLIAKLDSF